MDGLVNYLTKDGKRILDLHKYWQYHNNYPLFNDVKEVDVLISSEPTFCGKGKEIREKIIIASQDVFLALIKL